MATKPLLCTLTAAAMALAALALNAQTVDELVAKNIAARGGIERIKAIQSARITGRLGLHPGMEAPFTLELRRPGFMRLEFTLQGMSGIQAFDGTVAWTVMPFRGKPEPERADADEAKRFAESADFDGPLVDYARKGHRLELIGKESIEGTDAFKLKLTRKNGDVSFLYLDAETFLLIKEIGKTTVQGEEQDFESTSSDYKSSGGVLWAFSKERKPKGSPFPQVTTIEKIETNIDIPAARFAMPAAAPAPH